MKVGGVKACEVSLKVPKLRTLPFEMATFELHAQENKEAARKKAADMVEKLKAMKLAKASELVKEDIEETLHDMNFPREHWRNLQTDNLPERIVQEIRCRTRVVGAFPDGNSALMLVAARLRHVAATRWGSKRH
jgi:transposase-like protein